MKKHYEEPDYELLLFMSDVIVTSEQTGEGGEDIPEDPDNIENLTNIPG